jgi:hypothetical protein
MFGPGLVLLLALPAVVGLPLACVGLIVLLCEWSWGKRAGDMGSTGLLLAAGFLCLPLRVYITWALVKYATG